MGDKVSTGANFLDDFLGGGFEDNIVTTIYGPSGSGKTNLCLLTAVNIAKQDKKVVLIDTEGGVATERIKQLSGSEWERVLQNIIFFQPLNFDQQQEIFAKLKELVMGRYDVGIIVVDSISMLYRLELGKSESIFDTNSALARQIATLVEIARNKSILVLITNQVYADFDNKDKVKMVGGDLLKYGSKCLLELTKSNNLDQEAVRKIVLRKHRHLPEGKSQSFKIVDLGISCIEK